MNAKIKSILKYAISAAVAVVLLYFSFKGIEWKAFWVAVKSCSWGYVLLAIAAGGMAYVIRALRWRMLLLPIDPSTSFFSVLNAINISYITNIVLPRIGEFVRCGYVMKHSAVDAKGKKIASYDKVLGTVVVDRLWDIITVLAIFITLLFSMRKKYGHFLEDKVLGPMSSSLNLSMPLIIAGLVVCVGILMFLVWKFKESNVVFAKIWKVFSGIKEGITSCLKMKHSWKFFVYTILIWTGYWLTSVCIVWAAKGIDFGMLNLNMGMAKSLEEFDLLDAFFLMSVGALSSLVPVPGGFGAFHYLMRMALLTVYGIPVEFGIIFATLSHESNIIGQVVFGGISYIYETFKK